MTSHSERLDDQIIRLENELVRLRAAKLQKLAKPMKPKLYSRWPHAIPRHVNFGDSHYIVVSNGAGFRVMGPSGTSEWSAIKLWNEGVDHV